jgi:serine/threonine protein kinase
MQGKKVPVYLEAGLDYTTLFYRAPEILFGDVAFGKPVDLWSLGLSFVEACGDVFMKNLNDGKVLSQVGYMMAVFQQLGTPSCESLRGLPFFPKQPPAFQKRSWPETVLSKLDSNGLFLIESLLSWEAASRPTCRQAGRTRAQGQQIRTETWGGSPRKRVVGGSLGSAGVWAGGFW